jgi:hypothetical protein
VGWRSNRSLDMRTCTIPSWHVTHPGQAQRERLLGARPGEKIRDLFSTELIPANSFFS